VLIAIDGVSSCLGTLALIQEVSSCLDSGLDWDSCADTPNVQLLEGLVLIAIAGVSRCLGTLVPIGGMSSCLIPGLD
jgi:hypothetical protein